MCGVLLPEHELEAELLRIGVPVVPVPSCVVIGLVLYLPGGYPEGNGFVRFRGNLWTNY